MPLEAGSSDCDQILWQPGEPQDLLASGPILISAWCGGWQEALVVGDTTGVVGDTTGRPLCGGDQWRPLGGRPLCGGDRPASCGDIDP